MSLYGLDRALWSVYRSAEATAEFLADPVTFLAAFPLDDEESALLAARDVGALFDRGAHPFLVYSFELRLAGGFSYELTGQYLQKLEGKTLRGIET